MSGMWIVFISGTLFYCIMNQQPGRVRGGAEGGLKGGSERGLSDKIFAVLYYTRSFYKTTNPPTWHLDPSTPCAMLRQMLRPSLRPLSRSFPPRTQLATRGLHHTHSSKHRHNSHSTSHICCRRVCIPIQTSPALLQLGPSYQSK